MEEIWKFVIGYEGKYEVSNLGRVKSLDRYVKHPEGGYAFRKGQILKPQKDFGGYLHINLIGKCRLVHILVCESFLNHNQNDKNLVVNHINAIRSDNRLENLEIITIRENATYGAIKKNNSSNFTGVCFNKQKQKWCSQIHFKKHKYHLGTFINEIDASNIYKEALSNLDNFLIWYNNKIKNPIK